MTSMPGWRSLSPSWPRVQPALVVTVVLGVLVLHLLSRGGGLVNTVTDTPGGHPMVSVSIWTSGAHLVSDAAGLLPDAVDRAGDVCGTVCETPSIVMTCLLALVLLAGRLLLRAPPRECWPRSSGSWLESVRVRGEQALRSTRVTARSSLWLGISRT